MFKQRHIHLEAKIPIECHHQGSIIVDFKVDLGVFDELVDLLNNLGWIFFSANRVEILQQAVFGILRQGVCHIPKQFIDFDNIGIRIWFFYLNGCGLGLFNYTRSRSGIHELIEQIALNKFFALLG